ncbi:MAG: multidrug efflux RND transporter permease subunit [Pelosinus sp.]|nr:multidrug efflux RND transporter permease subunit [Pelosinus sp.]
MAKFFIERPIFAIVLSILITLAGLLSAFNLPIAQYPQITPPQVRVSANYQGANAEVVDQTVAQILEQQINGVENMTTMSSTSTDTGSYSLTVQFEPEANGDIAAVQTQNNVSQILSSLPGDVQNSGVSTKKSMQDMALIFSLYSPTDAYDDVFLKNYGSIYIVDEIKRVKGVGSVMEFGSDYSMRVWLQADKMAQLGITTSDIAGVIQKQNVQAPAGTIGQRPYGDSQDFQYSARVKGRLETPEEFGNVIVAAKQDGSTVRLKDVARIELANQNYSFIGKSDGHQAVGFAVQLTSDANALETITNVKKVLADSSKQFPAGLEYKISVDNTNFIRESIQEVIKTFIESLLLVLVVVFIFLQSWRATLIPMLAIPVSLIGTFAAFLLLHFTINTLTLFAMVLAIGLVVDDAIVVIEAVEHHMRYNGMSPKEATKRAMDEVSGPVVAIAFVLAAVFIPVAFFGGTMGILYKQFALTVAIAMALSAFIALSLTPALCAAILKPYNPNAHKGALGLAFDKFNDWFERTIESYGGSVKNLIPKAKACLVSVVVLLILTGFLTKLVPSAYVPEEDQGYFLTIFTLPEAASLGRTTEAINKLAAQIKKIPGVADSMTITGYDLLGGGTKPNAAAAFVKLEPWAQREHPAMQVKAIIGQVFGMGGQMSEGTVLALNPPALPGMGAVGGFTLMLEDKTGHSMDEMNQVLQKFLAAARQRPEIGMIYSTFNPNTPGFEYEVDRDKVAKLGIPVNNVFSTLQAFLGGTQVNDFNEFGRTYKVMIQADAKFRSDVNDTRFFYVKGTNGAMVPLNTLLKPKAINAASLITRFNGSRSMQINGSPKPGYSSGQAIRALEEVAAQTLPIGFNYEWSGQSREEKISGSKTIYIFALSLLFVFLCLAALYESWSVPFAVLLAVPTGIFGAFLFQYLAKLENSVYMQIGLIMLIGLAAKNAILIVEFAKVRVDNGMDVIQAAIEGAKLRLRPILMTSLAFIIGCLPLAMATGAGAGARNAMGTAVVGGMLMATSLGIFVIPVLFVAVEKITIKLQAWKKSFTKAG